MIGLHQAHRGAGFLEAENSIEAMELSWSMGLAPEIDVSTARDGVIVGFHDRDLARLVRGLPARFAGAGVGDLDAADLATLDVGEGDGPVRRIPLVADVLARLRERPERRLYLDIKQVGFPALDALVRDLGVAGQVILATNRDPWIAAWRSLQPRGEIQRWVWFDDAPGRWQQTRAELDALRAAGYPGVTQLQLHLVPVAGEMQPGLDVPRGLAADLAAQGIGFQAFPHSDDPAVYRRLLAAGVQSFATDHPRILLDVLAER